MNFDQSAPANVPFTKFLYCGNSPLPVTQFTLKWRDSNAQAPRCSLHLQVFPGVNIVTNFHFNKYFFDYLWSQKNGDLKGDCQNRNRPFFSSHATEQNLASQVKKEGVF